MKSISRMLSTLAIAGLISAFSVQAGAQDVAGAAVAEIPVQKIDATEFDLSSSEDAEALYQRIRRAARRVCVDQFGGLWNKGTAFKRVSCIRDAVDRAVTSADLPMMTEAHFESTEAEIVASR